MRRNDPNSGWAIPTSEVGVRVFPRCGTRTFSETHTRANNFGEFLTRPNKVCVVRDPFKRLCSAWYGLPTFRGRDWPDFNTLAEFIGWLIEQDPYTVNPHVAPFWSFLDGFWWPDSDQLILLEDFYRTPPYGLRIPEHHWHQTMYPEIEELKPHVKNSFVDWSGRDYELFIYAQKSPLVTGGKQATDDGHEI